MRARLTYLAYSPRTPQRLAQYTTELLVLLAAVAGLVAIVAGYSPVVAFAHIVAVVGELRGISA